MNYRYLVLIVLCLLFFTGFAQKIVDQSSTDKPVWMKHMPESELYSYCKGYGSAKNIEEAVELARINAIKILAAKGFTEISDTTIKETISDQEITDSTYKISEKLNYGSKTKVTLHKTTIFGMKNIDDYWVLRDYGLNDKVFEATVLWRVPKEVTTPVDTVVPQEYRLKEISGRILVPGWGQLYKHEWGKGYTLLISETLLLGAIGTSQYFYADNLDLATKYKGVSDNKYNTYKANYEDWEKVRNFSAMAFAGIYIYNIIDVVTALGEMRFAYQPRKLQIIPLAGKNQSGVLLTYRF
jgi:hypothetical protein